MSEKCKYSEIEYLELCQIFAYFSKVRTSHIFSTYFGISAALNILCSNFSVQHSLLSGCKCTK